MRYLVLALIFAVAGCGKKKLEYGLDLKDTIRINLSTEPPSLDWNVSTDTTSGIVIDNVMEGLVGIDLKDPELKPRPALATEWHSSPDAKTWTFTIRKGVKWSDGVDFTAQQVVDSFERLLNPKTASEYAYLLYSIKNGEAYYKGTIKDFSQVGLKVNDKGQIVIELNSPMSYLPTVLTHHSLFPIRKDLIAKYGDKWTEAGNLVGLGPYKLKIWDHDKALVMERNDSYWGEKAKTKNILCYMILEYSTAVNMFRAGRLDFQENIDWNQVPELKDLPGFRPVQILGTFYIGFNIHKPPFDDLKVRKAVEMAIDRKQITTLLGGGLQPLSSWVPPGMLGYEPDIGIKFDPAQAAKLLDEAGYKDRSKFPRFVMAFNTNENYQRMAENIQAQLKKNLGLSLELQNEEWKVYLQHLKVDPPNIYRMGWITDYPDPESFMKLITSNSENNYSRWKNKTYDDLVNEADSSLDPNKRKELYAKAQKISMEDEAPVFTIYTIIYPQLISTRIKNFPQNALEQIILKDTYIQ